MAKAKMSVSSDMDGLVSDLMDLVDDFSWEVKSAASKQMDFFSNAVRMNWNTMNPWQGTNTANFVSESIGYNVEFGKSGTVVGMGGTFKVDHVSLKYGRDPEKDISAPQFAYWVEYGFTPRGGVVYSATPFMDSAFYGTLEQQDEIFANELARNLGKRLNK